MTLMNLEGIKNYLILLYVQPEKASLIDAKNSSLLRWNR